MAPIQRANIVTVSSIEQPSVRLVTDTLASNGIMTKQSAFTEWNITLVSGIDLEGNALADRYQEGTLYEEVPAWKIL